MVELFSKLDSKRRLRLRVTLLAGVEYAATCAFLGAYWGLGKVEGILVVWFLGYAFVANLLILGGIASGWSERLHDPSMTAIQMTVSCARDLLGCYLMPGLWFVFGFNLFVALPFGSLQFSNRGFAWFWLLTCAGLGLIFFHYPERLQIGFDNSSEKMLLWAFISAALGRLMLFNSRVSALRRKLRSKAIELDQASRRLERERIARDLHDTLLQTIYGLVWRVAALAQQLSADDPIRGKFDSVLDAAERALDEGRRAVFGLRFSGSSGRTFTDTLTQAGEGLARESGIGFSVLIVGEEMPLQKSARGGLERILREAMSNAFHHSGGGNVALEVHFSEPLFEARVTDNGKGVCAAVARVGLDGHFGLLIMRERAAGIHAKLDIEPCEGGGTVVLVRLPAHLAYERPRSTASAWLGGWFGR